MSRGWRPPSASPHPSVVRVSVDEGNSKSLGSGTLVYVQAKHGLVITNWHVVRDAAGPVEVIFPDGFRSMGTVMKVDDAWDLAAIAIWRPKAAPVVLAKTAPKKGDVLTIAGYGGGSYRAATGRCTQYVAPGKRHPFEMIELSTEARQGDSGGPIFNAQGEIAGVLLGSRAGATVGSYCGRVDRFLVEVRSAMDAHEETRIAKTEGHLPVNPLAQEPDRAVMRPSEPVVSSLPAAPAAPIRTPLVAVAPSPDVSAWSPVQPARIDTGSRRSVRTGSSRRNTRPATTPRHRRPPLASARTSGAIRLMDLVGVTRAEQTKTALAAIGMFAILLGGFRLFRSEV